MVAGMKKVFSVFLVSFLFFAGSNLALSLDWQVETVEWYGNAGICPSLTLDSNGNPHTAYDAEYRDEQATGGSYFSDTHYSTQSETEWNNALVQRKSKPCGVSIALDSNDQPRIVGGDREYQEERIRWFECNNGTWTHADTGIGQEANPDYCLRIRNGVPAMAYGGWEQILYAEKDDGGWNETIVQPNEYSGNNMVRWLSKDSLTFDSLGKPHITYGWESEEKPTNVLKYAYRQDDEWILETVASLEIEKSGYYYKPAIILDGNDVPHIVALQGEKYAPSSLRLSLRHFFLQDGSWQEEIMDTGLLEEASVALDESGRLVAAYSKAPMPAAFPAMPSVYHPRVATLTGDGWVYEDVNVGGMDCREMSIEVGGGKTHLSFYNASGGNMMYACGTEGALGGSSISFGNALGDTTPPNPSGEHQDGTVCGSGSEYPDRLHYSGEHFFATSLLAADGLSPRYGGRGLVQRSDADGAAIAYLNKDGEAFKCVHPGYPYADVNVNALSHGLDDISRWLTAGPDQRLLKFSVTRGTPNDIIAIDGNGREFIEHVGEDFGVEESRNSVLNNLAAYDNCSEVKDSIGYICAWDNNPPLPGSPQPVWEWVNQCGNDVYISYGWHHNSGAWKRSAISVDDGYVHPGDIIYTDRTLHIPEDPSDPFYREPHYWGGDLYFENNYNVMQGYLRGWKFVDARTLALALGLDDVVSGPENGFTQVDIFLNYVMDIDALAVQDLDHDGVFDVGEDYALFSLVDDSVKGNIYLGREDWGAVTAHANFTGQFFDGTTIFLYDGLTATTVFFIDEYSGTGFFFGQPFSTGTILGNPDLLEIDALDIGVIPEPGTLLLLAPALLGIAGMLRKRSQRSDARSQK